MNDASAERWLPVVGFEGYYEVSDLGQVRSVDRMVARNGAQALIQGRMLATKRNPNGYRQCCLSRDGRQTYAYIHRLVAVAFIGQPKQGFEVCHYDGDRSNNHVSNLRWDTRKNNHKDKRRHGTAGNSYQRNKTHCVNGHEFTPENTRSGSNAQVASGTVRLCRQCGIETKRRYRQRLKEAS